MSFDSALVALLNPLYLIFTSDSLILSKVFDMRLLVFGVNLGLICVVLLLAKFSFLPLLLDF